MKKNGLKWSILGLATDEQGSCPISIAMNSNDTLITISKDRRDYISIPFQDLKAIIAFFDTYYEIGEEE